MSDAQVADLLQQGIAAVKEGRKEDARHFLMQVVDLDEENEQGWLWLSGVVETAEEQRLCLENVLALNPNSRHAQSGLEWLDQQAPAPSPVKEQALPAAAQDRCPRCEEPISSTGSECPHCGLPLIITCPSCGRYTEVHLTSCSNCGQALGDFRQGTAYYLSLAQAYLNGRKSEQAEEILVRAMHEAPNDAHAFESAAALYAKMGQSDKAISVYQQAIELAPKNPDLYAHLGALYRQQLKLVDARAMYEQAAKLAGSDPEILIELADLCLEEGQPKKAQELLSQVLRKEPENARAHLLMGNAFAGQNNREQAYRHYSQAVQMSGPGTTVGLQAEQQMAALQSSVRRQAEARQAYTAGRDGLRPAKPRHRPGCLTIYAILLALGGFFGALSTLLMGVGLLLGGGLIEELVPMPSEVGALPISLSFTIIMLITLGLGLFVSLLNLSIAIGLWRLKNWARILVIVLQSLSFLGGIVQAALTVSTATREFAAVGAQAPSVIMLGFLLVGFLIQAYILFWFVANGELFD